MDTIGLDLHKRESQLCVGHADGTITERRIVTSRERFTALFAAQPPARVLLEASTESEWVACHLEALGHTVIVADPNYAPMYATRSRRVKTDKRDARTLMEACRAGTYRRAHRLSARAACGAVRDAAERAGLHLRAPRASPALAAEFALPCSRCSPAQRGDCRRRSRLAALERPTPGRLLMTAPGIGPVTASAVVATLDDITRFRSAHACEAYLGLVPGERSSGEQRRVGPITKAGNSRVRWLLVELPGGSSAPRRPRPQCPAWARTTPPGGPADRGRRPGGDWRYLLRCGGTVPAAENLPFTLAAAPRWLRHLGPASNQRDWIGGERVAAYGRHEAGA
jgi:transposase